jgi:hypothetical protein
VRLERAAQGAVRNVLIDCMGEGFLGDAFLHFLPAMKTRHWKVPALQDLLQYRNPEVIARFCKDYGVDKRTANVLFKDLLRFLWLTIWAQEARRPKTELGMFEPMAIVDEMWHTFITFSREYVDFSVRYFGYYLHHNPARLLGGGASKESADDERRRAERTVELAWTELGPSVARRWFGEYKVKYSLVNIRRMQLAAARSR